MSDEYLRLLSRTSQGDQRAFAQLYELSSARLYAVSYQMLQRKDLAEEVLQEAYIKIWHNAGEYQQEKGQVISWMISIVRYGALDKLRAKKVRRETSIEQAGEASDTSAGPAQQYFQQRERVSIDRCMDTLELDQRNAIQLAYFYGYTHVEVCNVLASPLGSVKSWIRRGLEKLKRCLAL